MKHGLLEGIIRVLSVFHLWQKSLSGRENAMPIEYENTTKEIIRPAFEVHRVSGFGFLESVFQKSMQVEPAGKARPRNSNAES